VVVLVVFVTLAAVLVVVVALGALALALTFPALLATTPCRSADCSVADNWLAS
jgi:hypothetical protein